MMTATRRGDADNTSSGTVVWTTNSLSKAPKGLLGSGQMEFSVHRKYANAEMHAIPTSIPASIAMDSSSGSSKKSSLTMGIGIGAFVLAACIVALFMY